MKVASIDAISGTVRLPNYSLNLSDNFAEVSLLENNDLMIKLESENKPYTRTILKNDLVASIHVGAQAFDLAGIKSGDFGMCVTNDGIKIHCGGAL